MDDLNDLEFLTKLLNQIVQRAPRGQVYTDAVTLCALLETPFEGTISDLANASEIPTNRINSVLALVRSEEWIKDHGFTIPYVTKGRGPKTWVLVSAEDEDYHGILDTGTDKRRWECYRLTIRLRSHISILSRAADKALREEARAVELRLKHIIDIYELNGIDGV